MKIKDYLYRECTIKRRSQAEIAKTQNLPLDIIEYLIKRCNLCYSRTKFKYTFDESKLDLTNPIFWYYIGLIATDGYINKSNNVVALRIKNAGALKTMQALIKYFNYNGRLFKYADNYEFRICSSNLVEILKTTGIPNVNKTFTLEFPTNFPTEDCERMYFRGVHDGDGNIKRKKSKKADIWLGGGWRLLTSSHNFINGISIAFNRIFKTSYKLRINSRANGKEYPEFLTKDSDGKRFIKWVYQGYEEYRLEDKYLKAMSIF